VVAGHLKPVNGRPEMTFRGNLGQFAAILPSRHPARHFRLAGGRPVGFCSPRPDVHVLDHDLDIIRE
jgi:hypothetical protein